LLLALASLNLPCSTQVLSISKEHSLSFQPSLMPSPSWPSCLPNWYILCTSPPLTSGPQPVSSRSSLRCDYIHIRGLKPFSV
jgi:hypothetical protein